ncbi:MAG: hypothetical protein HGA97_01260 [Chlorobiaceae bacterium]|nr:hypothetical protein [Chlorobiaceae bacterium]
MTERIGSFWLNRLLGIPSTTPLTPQAMSASLQIAIDPAPELSPRLARFTAALGETFRRCGVSVVEHRDAGQSGCRYRAGTAVLAPGVFPDELLPINRVSTLYNNLIVGIYDGPPPVSADQTPQETLDAVIGRLAWEMVHLLIYVSDDSWTVCSMNGGIATFGTPLPELRDVLESLIPKITAQVVPPREGDLDILPGALDSSTAEFRKIAEDFVTCGRLWTSNHHFMNHTARESLDYRSGFYRKIVARYLDERSGMSYGFFARQLPVATLPAADNGCWMADHETPASSDGQTIIPVRLAGRVLLVPIPPVRIITTRSGCRKTDLDGRYDLVEIGFENGRARLATPKGLPPDMVSKPSFDTLTIIAHAVGNAMIASILLRLRPDSLFPRLLERTGCAMTHWHHYPDGEMVPEGYVVHGRGNPPVSCSTPQSAAYSLLGKLDALEIAIESGIDYHGDLHIEPGHGTNIVGTMSLTEMAAFLNPEPSAVRNKGNHGRHLH